MPQIGQLLKQLLALNPQSHPVRLAAYNYFSYFHDNDTPLSPEVLNTFFADCLEFPHWQQESKELGRELKSHLQSCWQESSAELEFNQFCERIRWPQETQIFTIEHFADVVDLLENYLGHEYPNKEKFRLVPDHGKKINTFILNEKNEILVRCFDNRFILKESQLIPLRSDLRVSYDHHLELTTSVFHKIEIGPYTTAKFTVSASEARGAAVRGYLFQKYLSFRNQPLRTQTKLFFAIKRLEQVFIDRRTDSFYLDLMDSLERTSNLLKMNDPTSIETAPGVIANAEAAFEQVFMGDKLLGLLIKDLKNLWHSKKIPQKFV